MGDINSIGPGTPGYFPENTDLDEKVSDTSNVLQNYIQNLTMSFDGKSSGKSNVSGSTIPTLPSPDQDIATGSDLAQLLLKLQTETTDVQLKSAIDSIKANKKSLEAKHKERMKKIEDAIKKSEKAAKSGKWGKAFGWIATGLSVLLAAASCVATGGLTLGAVMAVALPVMMQVLDSTGEMDKIMEGLTKVFKDMGLKEPAAQICAMVTVFLIVLLASKGGGKLSGKLGVMKIGKLVTLSKKFGNAAKMISTASKGAMAASMMGSGVSSGVGGYYKSESLDDKAESKEIMKFITKIQNQMDDEQDRIKELVDELQSGVSTVMEIMKNENETKKNIYHSMAV